MYQRHLTAHHAVTAPLKRLLPVSLPAPLRVMLRIALKAQLSLLLIVGTPAVFAASSATPATPAAAQTTAITTATTAERLESAVIDAIQPLMDKHKIPGLALALTIDGEPYFFNVGVASLDDDLGEMEVTEHTLFEIGSVSKTFTAALAAYAEQDGALALQDPVSRYLPELRGSAMDGVSLLNLATHTAGHFPLQFPNNVQTKTQLQEYFKAWQPQYFPGTQRTYANPGIGLLGLIAAKQLRQPFAQAMQEKIFQGLGLGNTFIEVPEEKMRLYAHGHNRQNEPVRMHLGPLGEEAYGVKSSAADLTRYLAIQMQLVKVSPELERALAQTRKGYFKTEYYVQDLVWEQYPLPLSLETLLSGNSPKINLKDQPVDPIRPSLPPQKNVLVNKTGSTGGFSTYVAFIPEKRFGFVLLANKYFPNRERVEVMWKILEAVEPEVIDRP